MLVKDRQILESYETLLMEYAAGVLGQAQSLIVTTHVALSPSARTKVNSWRAVSGACLENCRPVSMNENSLRAVLAQLDDVRSEETARTLTTRPSQDIRELLPEDIDIPPELSPYFTLRRHKTMKWHSVYPGIHSFTVPLNCKKSKVEFYKFKPGAKAPRHKHGGQEITLVLTGAFSDDKGQYDAGDLIIIEDNNYIHSPTACEVRGCICLTVQTGGMRLEGVLGRFLNPFLG